MGCVGVCARLCCTIVIVDLRLASGGRSKFFGEWGSGRVLSLPSGPASGPLKSLMHTSGSSCHTPAADVTE